MLVRKEDRRKTVREVDVTSDFRLPWFVVFVCTSCVTCQNESSSNEFGIRRSFEELGGIYKYYLLLMFTVST